MTSASLTAVARNLDAVRVRLAAAAKRAGRDPTAVRLIAVSKTQPATALAEALAAGQTDFGESYLQEALPKIESLRRQASVVWHFIGALQGNKTRAVAEHFDWVHTLDRVRIAERLSVQHPATLAPIEVCIEVNLSGEAGKSGVTPQDTAALAKYIGKLPGLRLRGLMAIPARQPDVEKQRRSFQRLRELLDALNRQGFQLDTLSMGMSADFEAAVLEGATCVRVGTAIFGAHIPKHSRNTQQPLS